MSSPISPLTYVAGLSIGQLCNGLGGIILFSVLLTAYVHLTVLGVLEIIAASIITWASISALGFMMSTFARDVRDFWVYSPLLNVVLAFLPPVFYLITYIPSTIRFVAYLAPTTYPAQIIQEVAGVGGTSQNMIPFGSCGRYSVHFCSNQLSRQNSQDGDKIRGLRINR